METTVELCAFRAARNGRLAAAISAVLAGSVTANAQQASAPSTPEALGEIIVTAQKRSEDIQSVPISLQAIDSRKLADLQISNFDEYSQYLPSLSVQSLGPGQAQLYVRGVTNGGDGTHLGSQPLVGLYVDEMPVTTIQQNLDIHVYDVARIEALSGPQGTLFGASSMAGTVRIITNKPDSSKFAAGYDIAGTYFTDGGPGGKVEGFMNLPISDSAAIRLVGWGERDGGYINVVRSSPQYFPTSGAPRDNASLVKSNANTVDTYGGRAALKVDFGDDWTVTPTLMAQDQKVSGPFAYTPFGETLTPTMPDGTQGVPMKFGATGDLNVAQYYPNTSQDNWWMGTLVIQGKIADFDLTYSGGYIRRNSHGVSDYSDYAMFYDVSYAGMPDYYGNTFKDSQGNVISPSQELFTVNNFTKQSHEIRLSTPTAWPLHGVLGFFWDRQYNDTKYSYVVKNLAPSLSVEGQPGTLFYQRGFRTDRDQAVFLDATYDLTSHWALTGGIRVFRYDNDINGFFGFGSGYPSSASPYTGANRCFTPIDPNNHVLPCENINSRATKSSQTHRVNVTYKIDDDRMIYATWSTGFRPGGINRLANAPSYNPDYLTNFEIGTKTMWLDHRLRVNGAVFYERWKDAQFSYPGPQGVTIIINAGRASIKGIEAEAQWQATDRLTVSSSLTLLDAKLLTNVCHYPSADLSCTETTPRQNEVFAPSGARLPVSSKFKGNMILRYEWPTGDYRVHAQAAAVYQSDALPALRTADQAVLGTQPGYGTVDLSVGVRHDTWSTELYLRNAFDRRGESIRYTGCSTATCKLVDVIPIQPRLIGLSFSQRF